MSYAADVGMRHLSGGAHFVVKLREAYRVGGNGVGQEFQRNCLAKAQIVSAIHLAHPTATRQADDAVAAIEDGARRKAAVTD